MIERMINMKDEKNLTIEELKAQYKALGEEIAQKEKAEAEERAAKLTAEKEARKAEIETVEKRLGELISAYIKDYGSYNRTRTHNDDGFPYLWHLFF